MKQNSQTIRNKEPMIFILDLFSDSKFLAFRKKCHQKGIVFADDILAYDLKQLLTEFLIPGSFNEIKHLLTFLNDPVYANYPDCGDIPIDDIFSPQTDADFLTYCRNASITLCSGLTKNNFRELFHILDGQAFYDIVLLYLVVGCNLSAPHLLPLNSQPSFRQYVKSLPEFHGQLTLNSKARSEQMPHQIYQANNTRGKYSIGDLYAPIELVGLLPEATVQELNNQHFITLKDFRNYRGDFYFLSKRQKTELLNLLYCCNFKLKEFMQHMEAMILNHKEYDAIKRRVVDNNTLEEVGNYYQISRERVRQKEIVIRRYITHYLLLLVKFYEQYHGSDARVFEMEELTKYCNDNDVKIIIAAVAKEMDQGPLSYSIEFQGFFWCFDYHTILSYLEDHMQEEYLRLQDKYDDLLPWLATQKIHLPFEYFQRVVMHFGYRIRQSYAIKSTCSARKIIEIIILHYYSDGMVLTIENMQRVIDIAQQEFGIALAATSADYRNVKAYFDPGSNGKLILWGNSAVNHIEHAVCSEEVQQVIQQTFEQLMENHDSISAQYLFETLESKIQDTNLADKIKLYGYVKYFYQDQFWFKKYFVRHQSQRGISVVEAIEAYVREHKKVKIPQIIDAIKCSEVTISATLVKSKVLVLTQQGTVMTTIDQYQLPVNFTDDLRQRLLPCLDLGYTTCHAFFQINQEFFLSHQIFDDMEAFTIAKQRLQEEFRFYRPFIQLPELNEITTYRKIFYRQFAQATEVELKAMEESQNRVLYSKGITNVIIRCFQDGILCQTRKDWFSLANSITIQPAMIVKLQSILAKLIQTKGYALQSEIGEVKGIEYFVKNEKFVLNRWSAPYIIKNFCDEFFVIDNSHITSYQDFFYAIVPVTSPIKHYSNFLYWLVSEEYGKGSMISVQTFLNCLKPYGIEHKKVPIEVEQDGYIKLIDSDVLIC